MSEESQLKAPAAGSTGANSPEAKAKTDWQMPAPVFRVSAGKTVKRSIAEKDEADAAAQAGDDPANIDALPDPPADFDLHQPPALEKPAAAGVEGESAPAVKERGSLVLRIVLSALGIFGTVLLLIIVLSLIYLYFFYRGGSGGAFD